MYRFFVRQENIDAAGGRIRIVGEDVNHIRNVLRMKTGEEVLLCSGRKEDPTDYLCRIKAVSQEEVVTQILERRPSLQELPCQMVLFQGLPKGDKLEEIIQKSVELGASAIVPVAMRRCVVRLDEKKAGRKADRWKAIGLSAAKQSKRGVIPEVTEVASFGQALDLARDLDRVIVPYERADGIAHTRQVLASVKEGDRVGIFIGPEGGFEEEEIRRLTELGAETVTLGHRILRTETAGPAILAMLMLNLER